MKARIKGTITTAEPRGSCAGPVVQKIDVTIDLSGGALPFLELAAMELENVTSALRKAELDRLAHDVAEAIGKALDEMARVATNAAQGVETAAGLAARHVAGRGTDLGFG